jgi:hypothetical protein
MWLFLHTHFALVNNLQKHLISISEKIQTETLLYLLE